VTRSALFHLRENRARECGRGEKIDADRFLQRLVAQIRQVFRNCNAGAGHENINRARAVQYLADPRGLGQVSGETSRRRTELADQALEILLPSAGGRDSATTRRQLMSDRATDASGGAGNEDASTFELHAQIPASFGDSVLCMALITPALQLGLEIVDPHGKHRRADQKKRG